MATKNSLFVFLVMGLLIGIFLTQGIWSERSPGAKPFRSPIWIFDQSNEQVYSPYDMGFSGMSEFARLIEANGFDVELNSRPLVKRLHELGSGDALFLGVAMFRRYTEVDRAAILAFWKRGGHVLTLVEHDDLMENATFQADLLTPLNIIVDPVAIKTLSGKTAVPYWVYASSQVFGIDKVLLPQPAPLHAPPDWQVLLDVEQPETANRHVAGVMKTNSARGSWVVIGDAELFWNGVKGMGIHASTNQTFVDALIRRLSKASAPVAREEERANRVFNLLQRRGIQCDRAPAAKLRCFITPTSTDLPSVARKNILVADGLSDIIGQFPELEQALVQLTGQSYRQPEYPLNVLLEGSGMRFAPATLVSREASNHLQIVGYIKNNVPLTLVRSSFIEISTAEADIIAYAKNTWPLRSLTPMQVFHGEQVDPFAVPESGQQVLPVVAKTREFFVIADLELLDSAINPEGAPVLLDEIEHWLKE